MQKKTRKAEKTFLVPPEWNNDSNGNGESISAAKIAEKLPFKLLTNYQL